VLDRETRTLSVGAVVDVQQCLRQATPAVLTLEAVTALLATIRARVRTPHNLEALVAHALQREHQLVTALKEWLDTP